MAGDLRMGCDQKGGLVKKTLGDSGLPKKQNGELKPMTQKGIMSKGAQGMGAGPAPKRPAMKGFGKGGQVQP